MMPRKCAEVQRELAWQLAEEGAGLGSRREIPNHLEECPRCGREAERLRGVLGSLGAGAVPDPGEAYWQAFLPRLRNRLAAEGAGGRTQAGWIWGLAATAASFLVAGLAVGQWGVPPEIRARLRLEQVAGGTDPESLQRVLDTLLPDSEPGAAPVGKSEIAAEAGEMERALEVIFPEYEADGYGVVGKLTPKQKDRLAQSLGPGWV